MNMFDEIRESIKSIKNQMGWNRVNKWDQMLNGKKDNAIKRSN